MNNTTDNIDTLLDVAYKLGLIGFGLPHITFHLFNNAIEIIAETKDATKTLNSRQQKQVSKNYSRGLVQYIKTRQAASA